MICLHTFLFWYHLMTSSTYCKAGRIYETKVCGAWHHHHGALWTRRSCSQNCDSSPGTTQLPEGLENLHLLQGKITSSSRNMAYFKWMSGIFCFMERRASSKANSKALQRKREGLCALRVCLHQEQDTKWCLEEHKTLGEERGEYRGSQVN